MKRIIAFDPGGTTGFVDARWQDKTCIELLEIRHIEWSSVELDVLDIIANAQPDIVVYELFNLYAHRADSQIGSSFPSAQVIGMIKLSVAIARRSDGRNIVLQGQPALNMTRVQVRDEHSFGLRGMVHATSAYKHLLYYVTSQYAKGKKS